MLRQIALKKWLEKYYNADIELEFAAADAEYRRYFRLVAPDGKTYIAMDAEPDKMDIVPYIRVQALFSMLNVPQIFAFDRLEGFVLLEDMGTTTYLQACNQCLDPAFHQHLLGQAVDELITLQLASQPNVLPAFNQQVMQEELSWFPDWFCRYELHQALQPIKKKCWDELLATLLPALLKQPQVFVHHDYIVRNIMLTDSRPGILDFQDALYGPITYDLVSLLRDAFIEWDETMVQNIVGHYWEKARSVGLPVPAAIDIFWRDFEWMSIQRHLKVIGVFARLFHRDGKAQYLPEIRRFLNYLHQTTARYKEWASFHELLHKLTQDYRPSTPTIF